MFERFFKVKGIALIDSTVAIFTKLIDKLQQGIVECNEEKATKLAVVSQLKKDVEVLDEHIVLADKMISNIRKITE